MNLIIDIILVNFLKQYIIIIMKLIKHLIMQFINLSIK